VLSEARLLHVSSLLAQIVDDESPRPEVDIQTSKASVKLDLFKPLCFERYNCSVLLFVSICSPELDHIVCIRSPDVGSSSEVL